MFVCEVEGDATIEQNEMEQDIENGNFQQKTHRLAHARARAGRLEIELSVQRAPLLPLCLSHCIKKQQKLG